MGKTELPDVVEEIRRLQERRPFPGYILHSDFESPIFVNENVWRESDEPEMRKDTSDSSVGKPLKNGNRESDGERMYRLLNFSSGNMEENSAKRREMYVPLTSSNQIVVRSKDEFLEDKVAKLRSYLRDNKEISEKLDGKPSYLGTREKGMAGCEMVSLKALESGSTYDREPMSGILKMKAKPEVSGKGYTKKRSLSQEKIPKVSSQAKSSTRTGKPGKSGRKPVRNHVTDRK